ncbi:MAG TPA: class I SAM-dependent methyltransferase [Sphingomicrobium sp.]|nr:class I SAM-dependent methyltransferase [Sphingomicrobium sp.]
MRAVIVGALLASVTLATACNRADPATTEADTRPSGEALEANAEADAATADADGKKPDVIYVPTPQPVVDAMLKMAKVGKGDVLYDLGSGDGRIPITAAREHGIRAVGIEIDPERIAEANANIAKEKVGDLVTIRSGDLFEADFSDATVVTLYLLDSLNEKLRPKLLGELKPGTRIVSHMFRMGDWEPEAEQNIDGSMIYLWTVPERG